VLRALRFWGPALAWMAFIFFASARPLPGPVRPLPDWTTHVGGYGVLGLLMARAVASGRGVLPAKELLLAVALSTAYGITDEVHQGFVPERTPDVRDAAFDLVGSALGAVFFRELLHVRALLAGNERRQGGR
jgi:VanZ family protein